MADVCVCEKTCVFCMCVCVSLTPSVRCEGLLHVWQPQPLRLTELRLYFGQKLGLYDGFNDLDKDERQ